MTLHQRQLSFVILIKGILKIGLDQYLCTCASQNSVSLIELELNVSSVSANWVLEHLGDSIVEIL